MLGDEFDESLEESAVGNDIGSREWLIALLIAVAAAAVLSLPYLLGYLLAQHGTVYTGVIMNPEDTQSYFAKMLQGYDGQWLYSIPFTPEKHVPAFLGGFYLLLGHFAHWLGLSLEGIWHLSRFLIDIFLFMVTFGFIKAFLDDRTTRWLAFTIAIFGSGLGWLLFLLQQPNWLGAFPVDFKMPEAHLFFTALTFPHVALGTALILISFWLLWEVSRQHPRSWLLSFCAGLSNLTLGIVYPFLIYLVVLTTALYWFYLIYRHRRLDWLLSSKFGITLLIPAPLYVYYVYVHQVNEVFRSWSNQAVLPSPPWPHYLIAYGLLLLLAILPIAAKITSDKDRARTSLLWIWIVSAAILIFLPLNAQRRFVQGLHIPLSILAAGGIVQVVLPKISESRLYGKALAHPRYNKAGLNRLILTTVVLFLSLSNLYLLADVSLTAALRQPYPFFRFESEMKAVEWLRDNTDQSAIVMASYETGNLVAARAGNRVFIGHWAETVNWKDKYDQVSLFFDNAADDEWRESLIDEFGIDYVWYGRKEREIGDFNPEKSLYLIPAYAHDDVVIFKVS